MDGAAVPDPAADALPVARLGSRSLGAGTAAVVAAVLAGLAIGPVNISLTGVALELLDQLPLVDVDGQLDGLKIHQGGDWIAFRKPLSKMRHFLNDESVKWRSRGSFLPLVLEKIDSCDLGLMA